MSRIKTIPQIQEELLRFFEKKDCVTSSGIAALTGINQSQVFRNLFQEPKRVTKTLHRLCSYANIPVLSEPVDPRTSSILMEALGAVWDGSDQHAKRLAALLFAHQKACL